MRVCKIAGWVLPTLSIVVSATTSAPSTAGIESLLKRRLPRHQDAFEFAIDAPETSSRPVADSYTVSSTKHGKIRVKGTSTSAVISGLHRYLADVVNVDIWWYIGSQLDQAPLQLPKLHKPLKGSAVVPYRYHFNTVTFSYTSAFWSWEDWELQLDWMALRGINLPLAWVGFEKIVIDVFREVGLNDKEISSFLSGPAFQAWNRFGNIQGSWGGDLPEAWVNAQFQMQRKIVKRMVELGMTPVLPAFTGFVPRNISRVWPDATLEKSPLWDDFSKKYSADTYLDPFDPHFDQLQKKFITKQLDAYGNVTHFWTLDQFNENKPASEELDYLHHVSHNTWKALKAADPDAVWVMQGWLFASDPTYWTKKRVKALLDGVKVDSDMLILDLFSESSPQWQRTKSFFGKPWIWCQLHDFGGNMGLYGQIENVTINSMEAVRESKSLVGFGLTPEGQEGNEVIYNLLLDQAWSDTAIDTPAYFQNWVATRYGGNVHPGLYTAWEMVRGTVFNNTNLTVQAVPKSPLELVPSTEGLLGLTGHHPTIIPYKTQYLVKAWRKLYKAGLRDQSLFTDPTYQYDLVDWTRQVLVNAFIPLYEDLIDTYKSSASKSEIKRAGKKLTDLLKTVDTVLSLNKSFRLSTWMNAARESASAGDEDFFEYNARNQITLWGPTGQIEDYASKQWAGLVGPYYGKKWQMFIDYLVATPPKDYDDNEFHSKLLKWEIKWVEQASGDMLDPDEKIGDIKTVIGSVVDQWSGVFQS